METSFLNERKLADRDDVPPKYIGAFERAIRSRASAVKAMCLDCMGFDRKAVGACSARGCPLWTWRPYQPKSRDSGS